MTIIANPHERLWRTDTGRGRNIYALISNNPLTPSENDPLVGSMESSELAELVVEAHNTLMGKFGRFYQRYLENL